MKRMDSEQFAEQDVRGQQPVEEAVVALVLKFQARTGARVPAVSEQVSGDGAMSDHCRRSRLRDYV